MPIKNHSKQNAKTEMPKAESQAFSSGKFLHRLPVTGKTCTVHSVSVEGRADENE
jgi:hypothetical protein